MPPQNQDTSTQSWSRIETGNAYYCTFEHYMLHIVILAVLSIHSWALFSPHKLGSQISAHPIPFLWVAFNAIDITICFSSKRFDFNGSVLYSILRLRRSWRCDNIFLTCFLHRYGLRFHPTDNIPVTITELRFILTPPELLHVVLYESRAPFHHHQHCVRDLNILHFLF